MPPIPVAACCGFDVQGPGQGLGNPEGAQPQETLFCTIPLYRCRCPSAGESAGQKPEIPRVKYEVVQAGREWS